MSPCVKCGQRSEGASSRASGTPPRSVPAPFASSSAKTPSLGSFHPGAIVDQLRSPVVSTSDLDLGVPDFSLMDELDGAFADLDDPAPVEPPKRPSAQVQEAPFKPFQTEDLPSSPMRKIQAAQAAEEAASAAEVEELSMDDALSSDELIEGSLDELGATSADVVLVEDQAEPAPAQGRSVLQALRDDPLIGALIGRYRILRKIGAGGFGAVYEAQQEKLDRKVAIKILQVDLHEPVTKERFFREARALGRLRHQHIVQIIDFGEIEGEALYLVMELLEGPSLRDFLRGNQPLPLSRVRRITSQLCQALDYIHEEKIYHRDLKPGNILMVAQEGYGEVIKLIDFGVASMAEEENALTRTGACLGSPSYMSPEQAKGNTKDVDGRSDIYSLGILIYQMLTGRLPFKAPNFAAMLSKHLFAEPPGLAEAVPDRPWAPALEQALQYALAKEPSERPPDVETFAQICEEAFVAQLALERGEATPDATAEPSGAKPKPLQPPPSHGGQGAASPFQPMGDSAGDADPNGGSPFGVTSLLTPPTGDYVDAAVSSGGYSFDEEDEATVAMPNAPFQSFGSPAEESLSHPESPFARPDDTQVPGAGQAPSPMASPRATMLDPMAGVFPQESGAGPQTPDSLWPEPSKQGAALPTGDVVGPPLQQAQNRAVSATMLDVEPSWESTSPDWDDLQEEQGAGTEDFDDFDPGRSRRMMIALGSVALVIFAVLGWVAASWLSSGPSAAPKKGADVPQPKRAGAPQAKAPPAPARPRAVASKAPKRQPQVLPIRPLPGTGYMAPTARTWKLKLQSTPSGAAIWQGRKRIGTTPAVLSFVPKAKLQLQLRLRGYQAKWLKMTLAQDVTSHSVALQAAKPARRGAAPRKKAPPRLRDLYGIDDSAGFDP